MLGSHNSISYLVPVKFRDKLTMYHKRCQEIDINHQYYFGVRYFDIGIKPDKDWFPHFSYDGIDYGHITAKLDNDIFTFLDRRNYTEEISNANYAYIRIVLDIKEKPDNTDEVKTWLRNFVVNLRLNHPHLKIERVELLWDDTAWDDFEIADDGIFIQPIKRYYASADKKWYEKLMSVDEWTSHNNARNTRYGLDPLLSKGNKFYSTRALMIDFVNKNTYHVD